MIAACVTQGQQSGVGRESEKWQVRRCGTCVRFALEGSNGKRDWTAREAKLCGIA